MSTGPDLTGLAAIVLGTALVALNLSDIFRSVILPRATGVPFRLSAWMVRLTWAVWKRVALGIEDSDRREEILGAYAPLALVGFLLLWAAGLILGYGFIFYGLRFEIHPTPNLGEATYYAGVSFLTIGYGDFVATSGLARFISLVAGGNGFAVVAIVTSFLFSIFGAFATRENFVVTFAVRGGAPPSGVTLLETYARLGITADLDAVFEEGLRWSAAVLESHLAYPILAYFRSSHDYESWVGALGALLDASTLQLTLLEGAPVGHAKLYNEMARHLVRDLSSYFRFKQGDVPGVERAEFEIARERLRDAGLAVRETDDAWEKFVKLRSAYATPLNETATYFRIPPAQWIGDRSYLSQPH
jgi:hypothetical protein